MVAEIIRPAAFSVDPAQAGPVQRMRLANANAANAFHAVEDGLHDVTAESAADERRAAELSRLAATLSRQMDRLIEETRRMTTVLRAQ
ncbi:hypothetical protein C882_3722 [Caenispirillum salinarum AK4]|uniref:Uncharacterized protein n=1 Tax=Caenispirillum salinarum AK4 TaxID=1238182 RepID=K9H2R2_9PROT|nr:hypothetical protein [Caenispirillum salinarum]EKV31349.1 hypothetical protein C882_3722 [Caenispirillum salinarum AK4]